MSITIKKIAEVSGVSRGTVDRVLNNREGVNKETADKVRRCAEALGYTPNIAGKSLAVRKKAYVIGVLLNSKGNPFFDEMINSINDLAKEYAHYGMKVVLKQMRGFDVSTQLEMLEELEKTASAIILTPIDDELIRNKINELSEKNIPVVTVNTDIKNSKRLCYVGTDYKQGGKIVAGLLALIKPNGAKIGIVHGSKKMYGHNQRVLGFEGELNSSGYKVLSLVQSHDDDIIAYEKTSKMLSENPNIDTIFVVASGVYGVCRAVISSKKDITILTFDDIPSTIELLEKGIIKATVSQQPAFQGHKAMEIMFEYLVAKHIPLNEEYLIENQIKIKQNYR
ncbi:MAG: LacI family DNA-binding transcriptional regulator [Clostridia bacterium]